MVFGRYYAALCAQEDVSRIRQGRKEQNTTWLAAREKDRNKMSLEPCLEPFRPRSALNYQDHPLDSTPWVSRTSFSPLSEISDEQVWFHIHVCQRWSPFFLFVFFDIASHLDPSSSLLCCLFAPTSVLGWISMVLPGYASWGKTPYTDGWTLLECRAGDWTLDTRDFSGVEGDYQRLQRGRCLSE